MVREAKHRHSWAEHDGDDGDIHCTTCEAVAWVSPRVKAAVEHVLARRRGALLALAHRDVERGEGDE